MLSTTALIGALAFSFAGQFTEGSAVAGQGCTSAITGSLTNVVATSMAVFHNSAGQQPKQGETFQVVLNIAAFPQPCATTLTFRPGIKLPAGVTFVPNDAFNAPQIECFKGRSGALTRVTAAGGCPFLPTEVLPDGTLMLDPRQGLWAIPDSQMLQLVISVTSRAETDFTGTTVQGHVDYAAPDGFRRSPLRPSAPIKVYFNIPTVDYPNPATTAIGPYSAHVAGFVDPHFNAGRIDLELAKIGEPFAVVDTSSHDGSSFSLDVASELVDLDPDTEYQWRYRYFVQRNSFSSRGLTSRFRTLPAPRFVFSSTVVGQGAITTSPAVESDGTFIDRSVVTLTATPATGHRLVSFVVDGGVVAGASKTVTIAAPLTTTATFELIPVEPSEGEGEGEGEGEEPGGEGEGEQPGGEGEGEQPDGEGEGEGEGGSDDDDEEGGCASGGLPTVAALLVVLRRRRRHQRA